MVSFKKKIAENRMYRIKQETLKSPFFSNIKTLISQKRYEFENEFEN